MEKFTVQVKVSAVFDVEKSVEDLDEAMALAKTRSTFGWKDFLLDGVGVADGTFKVVGVWANDWGTLDVDTV